MGKTIVVAWDFSQYSEFALNYAIYFANHFRAGIKLAHIAKNDKELAETEQKLQIKIRELAKIFNGETGYQIKTGNLYTEIGRIAAENFAILVIMGTPGANGFQKITGSRALRVITGNEIPFLVIHRAMKQQLKRVLFLVGDNKETLQKLPQAKFLSDNFSGLTFEVCYLDVFALHPNISVVTEFFDKQKIKYEKKVLKGKNLHEAATEYLKNGAVCNMAITMTSKNPSIADRFLGIDEEKIIFNDAKIPVMCINLKQEIL